MSSKKYSFRASEPLENKINTLREKEGFSSDADIARTGIIMLYNHLQPSVQNREREDVQVNSGRNSGRPKKTNEEKKQEQLEEAKQTCQKLGGTVVDNNGAKKCEYYTYSLRDRFSQSMPLEALPPSELNRQYDPDEETVKELQRKGKTNYSPND